MTIEDRTFIHASIWLAIGALGVLRDKARDPSAVDERIADLQTSSEKLMAEGK